MPELFFEFVFVFFFYEYFSFSLTWAAMGRPTFQNATPPSNHYRIFWNFSWIFFSIDRTKYCFDLWNVEFVIFNEFLKFIIVSYGKTKNLNYLEKERP